MKTITPDEFENLDAFQKELYTACKRAHSEEIETITENRRKNGIRNACKYAKTDKGKTTKHLYRSRCRQAEAIMSNDMIKPEYKELYTAKV